MLISALEGDRINTKGRIAYLGGAHAEGPLLSQNGRSSFTFEFAGKSHRLLAGLLESI